MEPKKLTRRELLRYVGLAGSAGILAACQPKIVEVEKIVEKEVTKIVKEVVKETVVKAPPAASRIAFWSIWSAVWGEGKAGGMYLLTERFNEEHEGELYVDYVYSPTVAGTQMSEKLLVAIAAGTPPQTAVFDRFIVSSWAAQDTLTDISELAAQAGFTKDIYFKFAWDEIHWKDKIYALPLNGGIWGVFFFNKDHLREAGLDAENIPTSLDELDAMAETLSIREGPRFKRIGFIPWIKRWPYGVGWTFGAEFYNKQTLEITVNDPRMVAGFEWELSYADKYDIAELDTFAQLFGGAAQEPFTAELLSMMSHLDRQIENFKRYNPDLDFGATYMPWPEGGRPAVWSGGWSVVIPKGAPNQQEGWKFLSWLGAQEQMEWFAVYNMNMPVHPKSVQNEHYRSDPRLQFIAEHLLPIACARPVLPVGQMLWTGLNEVEDLCLHGKGSPQELLDDLNKRANEEMQKFL